ncbi:PD-(D/E)XK nuclease family protein [Pseudactinotalea sp. Z1732]|uniref:PD-(D/E)XK nuclease family protein n=1 Tax=Pseudactinotalea sp. Z1732 TaxID=3413026 RepID=UPI003C7A8026
MLQHITTAYGLPALDRLHAVVNQVKAEDPMAPVLVLAPSNIAGTVARRHLAREGSPHGPGIAGIDITVTTRLAEQLATPILAPRRPLTRQVLAAGWRRALATDPGIFEETADHPATVQALMQAHTELRDLSEAELDQVSAAGTVSRDLVRLHRQVVTAMAPQWYDRTDILTTATGHIPLDPLAAAVIVYLPQDLTVAEQSFLHALARNNEVTVLLGSSGVARADEGSHRLIASDALERLDAPVPTATGILNTSDSDDEVRTVVRHVLDDLNNAQAHRIAVLYTAADPYAALLHDHLRDAGVRINGTGSRPIIDRALSRAVLGLLDLAADEMPRAGLFRTLADAPFLTFTGGRVPVARWERISREAGVVSGTDWRTRLDRYIQQQHTRADRAHEDDRDGAVRYATAQAQAAADLQQFVHHLAGELQRATQMTGWTDLATWCQDLITTCFGEPGDLTALPPEEQYAAAAIRTTLGALSILDDIDSTASLAALRQALDADLSEAIPRLGRFGDGVLVAPLSHAVGLDADVVYVLGLSEDLYPGRPSGDSLLPDPVRSAVGPLTTLRDRQGTAYRHLLAAFAAAPHVVASFPRGDLRSSSRRLPSRWLLGTLRELAGDNTLAATDWDTVGDLGGALSTSSSFSAELLRGQRLATDQEWRTRAAATDQLNDAVVHAAQETLRARAGAAFTRYDGNLTASTDLPDYRDGRRPISPTALERYVSCPHSFFVERVLGVRPIEQPEDLITISPMEVGNLVHRSFDTLAREFADDLPGFGEPWSAAHRSRLIGILHEQAAAMEADGLTGHPRLWRRERDQLEVDMAAMLDADDERRAERAARVAASEMPFGLGGQDPVTLQVPNGNVLLLGSADKVDLGQDGTVYVTDIKTGSRRSFEAIKPDNPLAGGTRLQLPVYGLAARDRFGNPDSPVQAEYWFVRKEPGYVGIEVDAPVIEALASTVDLLTESVSAGLFPPRPPETPDFMWVQCAYCNPDGIGHATARERWERQRHDPALAHLVALLEPEALDQEDA